jgi:hypothetical protein
VGRQPANHLQYFVSFVCRNTLFQHLLRHLEGGFPDFPEIMVLPGHVVHERVLEHQGESLVEGEGVTEGLIYPHFHAAEVQEGFVYVK